MNTNLNIAYACDNNYIEQTGISMISLFENNKEFENISIYFIDMGISDTNKNKLRSIVNSYNRRIDFVKFEEIAWDLEADQGERHIRSVYAKLFLFRLSDKLKKILYIDSDTIIKESLLELWNQDIEGKCIAATITTCKPSIKRKLNLPENSAVVNDGIVLIDLNIWRDKRYLEKCLHAIKSFGGHPPVLSEGIINMVLHDDIYYMHPKFNVTAMLTMFKKEELDALTGTEYYSGKQVKDAVSSPTIIHYAGNTCIRPWFKNSEYPLNEYYFEYRNISMWKNEPMKTGSLSMKMRIIRLLHTIIPSKLFVQIYKMKNK